MKFSTYLNTLLLILFGLLCSPLSGQAEVTTLESPAAQTPSASIRASFFDGASKVEMLNLVIKTGDEDIFAETLDAQIHYTDKCRTLYLYEGVTLLSASTAQARKFNLYRNIPKNTTRTWTLRADFETEVAGGQAYISVSDLVYTKPDGAKASTQGMVSGNTQYFFEVTANYGLVALPTISFLPSQNNAVTASFRFHLTASGGNIVKPEGTDFGIRFLDVVSGDYYSPTSTVVVMMPVTDAVADGTQVTVVVSAYLHHPEITSKGLYLAKVHSVRWQPVGMGAITQNWGLSSMITPITNVSSEDQSKLTILDTYLHDEQSSERDNTFIMTLLVPDGKSFEIQSSEDLVAWNTGWMMSASELATLANGTRVFKAYMFAPRVNSGKTKMFYRALIP